MKNLRLFKDEYQSVMIDCNANESNAITRFTKKFGRYFF